MLSFFLIDGAKVLTFFELCKDFTVFNTTAQFASNLGSVQTYFHIKVKMS